MKTESHNGGANAHAGMLAAEKDRRINSTSTLNETVEAAHVGAANRRFLERVAPIGTIAKAVNPGGGK